MQIWEACQNKIKFVRLEETVWRIVEDQFKSSTRKIVDTVEEYDVLEALIEGRKPKIKYYGDEEAFFNLHYLLYTPFRYPPLRHGSRFGRRHERNLFYASIDLETVMFEKAYYRLAFLRASTGNISGGFINYTAFNLDIKTNKGIDLCKDPFVQFRNLISSPTSYLHSQALGTSMRHDGVEAFISYSARSNKNGKNVNIFTPKVFTRKKLLQKNYETFECYFTKRAVEFYSKSTLHPIVFDADTFKLNGQFPLLPMD